jgi:hypothetical protein
VVDEGHNKWEWRDANEVVEASIGSAFSARPGQLGINAWAECAATRASPNELSNRPAIRLIGAFYVLPRRLVYIERIQRFVGDDLGKHKCRLPRSLPPLASRPVSPGRALPPNGDLACSSQLGATQFWQKSVTYGPICKVTGRQPPGSALPRMVQRGGRKLAEDRPIIRSEAAKLGKSTMPGDCFYAARGRIGPLEGATASCIRRSCR